MKKLVLFFLIGLFAFDFAEAQMAFNGGSSQKSFLPGLSQQDEFSSLLAKKRKKKRRKSSPKRGKGSSGPQATFGAGLAYSLPMGDFADGVKGGIGFNVDGDYFVAPTFSVGVNTGMYNFNYDVVDDTLFKYDKSTYKVIPLCLKATYYFGEGPFRPFVGLNLGMFINNSKLAYSLKTSYYNPVTDSTEQIWLKSEIIDIMTKFGFAPMAGFLYDISDNLMLNFNARYDYIMSKDDKNGFVNGTFVGLHFGLLYKF